jgi:hypothetical protein
MENAQRRMIALSAGLLLVVAILLVVLLIGRAGDGDDGKPVAQKDVQTVSFQEPDDPGPDPFTKPTDVLGRMTVPVSAGDGSGSQPFGGSGSNRVCDRDKLIRFLKRNPQRMVEWARVLGVTPTFRAVKRYIAKLHPVTLTRDTRITNHAFRNGRAVAFQAILQAGTAVLVDKYDNPVVRCYCGNPLAPAVFTKTATCTGCPPNYKPPKQCKYGRFDDYDEAYYKRSYYSNGDYDEIFLRRHRQSRYRDCFEVYPDPPLVTIVNVFRQPEPEPEPLPAPEPQPEPVSPPPTQEPGGLNCEAPQSQLEAEQCAALTSPQPAPEPEPTPAPDICNDGIDNEGVPGLVDGDDPNCQ